eukprot:10239416-Heterocapsa_arctica.AAC.1
MSSAAKPAGSQKQTGACMPGSLSYERSGEALYRAQSLPAEPVRPSWGEMPMVAVLASWPFGVSA